MQVGVRLHDVAGATIEDKVRTAHEQGFRCAHIALAKLIRDYSTADSALTPGFAMYLRKLFADNGLDIAVLGCYLNLATPDKEELKRSTERYIAHMRFASWLGCGVVGTETGCPNTEYRTVPECQSEDALKLFIERVQPVVEAAEKFGTVLAIEPVCRHIVCTPERARRVLEEVASPNLRIILDPVNLLDIWNYQDYRAIIRNAADCLEPYIDIVHIKDFRVENGVFKSGPVGSGQMVYDDIADFVEKRKPYIQCTLEETVPDGAVRSRELFEAACAKARRG